MELYACQTWVKCVPDVNVLKSNLSLSRGSFVPVRARAAAQRVLESAAENHGISVEELLEVPEGNRRRSMHDDITCVVFFLNGNRNNEGFTSVQGTKVQGVAVASESQGNRSPAQ